MMAAPEFDKIPSTISISKEKSDPIDITVEDELRTRREQLEERTAICGTIKRFFKDVTNVTTATKDPTKQPKLAPVHYAYKYICVCPRFAPKYKCEHSGNVILDRDVLTKEEHLCFLATPRKNYGAPRRLPYMYTKKIIRPNCTARIESLSKPSPKRIQENLQTFKKVLTKKATSALKGQLEMTEPKPYMNLTQALEFIEEEKRLLKVRRGIERRRCRKMKRCILRKQRKQIRQIICILFEEMKEFLLNDQFVIDDQSPLCAVILEKIREFTDKEFYTTNNLREYQRILANNLSVWINKFVSNLNIHVTQPPQKEIRICEQAPEISTFLPVEDYISCSENGEDEICAETEPVVGMEEYDNIGDFTYESTENTNP